MRWSGGRADVLPGDPDFGDPLSTAGQGGPRAAARATGRLLGERGGASREVGLGALQVWQAVTEAVSPTSGKPRSRIVFTDLVGFSTWSLHAGDDATLKLLARVARAIEAPLLDVGGHIVKRMGDGTMAVFADPLVAVGAVLEAKRALKSVDVDGYKPRMRVGIHTGRPQRLAADWLGVDVNVAARVMERATRGGVMVSGTTLDQLGPHDLSHSASPPNACIGRSSRVNPLVYRLIWPSTGSSRPERMSATYQDLIARMTRVRRHSRWR